jgi:hypothetical protein
VLTKNAESSVNSSSGNGNEAGSSASGKTEYNSSEDVYRAGSSALGNQKKYSSIGDCERTGSSVLEQSETANGIRVWKSSGSGKGSSSKRHINNNQIFVENNNFHSYLNNDLGTDSASTGDDKFNSNIDKTDNSGVGEDVGGVSAVVNNNGKLNDKSGDSGGSEYPTLLNTPESRSADLGTDGGDALVDRVVEKEVQVGWNDLEGGNENSDIVLDSMQVVSESRRNANGSGESREVEFWESYNNKEYQIHLASKTATLPGMQKPSELTINTADIFRSVAFTEPPPITPLGWDGEPWDLYQQMLWESNSDHEGSGDGMSILYDIQPLIVEKPSNMLLTRKNLNELEAHNPYVPSGIYCPPVTDGDFRETLSDDGGRSRKTHKTYHTISKTKYDKKRVNRVEKWDRGWKFMDWGEICIELGLDGGCDAELVMPLKFKNLVRWKRGSNIFEGADGGVIEGEGESDEIEIFLGGIWRPVTAYLLDIDDVLVGGPLMEKLRVGQFWGDNVLEFAEGDCCKWHKRGKDSLPRIHTKIRRRPGGKVNKNRKIKNENNPNNMKNKINDRSGSHATSCNDNCSCASGGAVKSSTGRRGVSWADYGNRVIRFLGPPKMGERQAIKWHKKTHHRHGAVILAKAGYDDETVDREKRLWLACKFCQSHRRGPIHSRGGIRHIAFRINEVWTVDTMHCCLSTGKGRPDRVGVIRDSHSKFVVLLFIPVGASADSWVRLWLKARDEMGGPPILLHSDPGAELTGETLRMVEEDDEVEVHHRFPQYWQQVGPNDCTHHLLRGLLLLVLNRFKKKNITLKKEDIVTKLQTTHNNKVIVEPFCHTPNFRHRLIPPSAAFCPTQCIRPSGSPEQMVVAREAIEEAVNPSTCMKLSKRIDRQMRNKFVPNESNLPGEKGWVWLSKFSRWKHCELVSRLSGGWKVRTSRAEIDAPSYWVRMTKEKPEENPELEPLLNDSDDDDDNDDSGDAGDDAAGGRVEAPGLQIEDAVSSEDFSALQSPSESDEESVAEVQLDRPASSRYLLRNREPTARLAEETRRHRSASAPSLQLRAHSMKKTKKPSPKARLLDTSSSEEIEISGVTNSVGIDVGINNNSGTADASSSSSRDNVSGKMNGNGASGSASNQNSNTKNKSADSGTNKTNNRGSSSSGANASGSNTQNNNSSSSSSANAIGGATQNNSSSSSAANANSGATQNNSGQPRPSLSAKYFQIFSDGESEAGAEGDGGAIPNNSDGTNNEVELSSSDTVPKQIQTAVSGAVEVSRSDDQQILTDSNSESGERSRNSRAQKFREKREKRKREKGEMNDFLQERGWPDTEQEYKDKRRKILMLRKKEDSDGKSRMLRRLTEKRRHKERTVKRINEIFREDGNGNLFLSGGARHRIRREKCLQIDETGHLKASADPFGEEIRELMEEPTDEGELAHELQADRMSKLRAEVVKVTKPQLFKLSGGDKLVEEFNKVVNRTDESLSAKNNDGYKFVATQVVVNPRNSANKLMKPAEGFTDGLITDGGYLHEVDSRLHGGDGRSWQMFCKWELVGETWGLRDKTGVVELTLKQAEEAKCLHRIVPSIVKEIESIVVQHGCVDVSSQTDSDIKGAISSRLVLQLKFSTVDGSFHRAKARWVARGFEQEVTGEKRAPTALQCSLYAAVQAGLNNDWLISKSDVPTAFLRGDAFEDHEDEVWLKVPAEVRNFGVGGLTKSNVRLRKCIYGLAQAPRRWQQHIRRKLRALGMVSCSTDPCLWVMPIDPKSAANANNQIGSYENDMKKALEGGGGNVGEICGVCCIHVDDVVYCGSPEFREKFQGMLGEYGAESQDLLEDGDPWVFLGRKFIKNGDEIRITQVDYSNEIQPITLEEQQAFARKRKSLKRRNNKFLLSKLKSPARKVIGELNWCQRTNPLVSFGISQAGRLGNAADEEPTEEIISEINAVVAKVKEHQCDYVLRKLDPVKNGKQLLVLYADAGSVGSKATSLKGKIGAVGALLGGSGGELVLNPLSHYSTSPKRVVRSSAGGETIAGRVAGAEGLHLKVICDFLNLTDENVPFCILTDSNNLRESIVNERLPCEKNLHADSIWISEMRSERKLELLKIPGKENVSDILTKENGELDVARSMFQEGRIGPVVHQVLKEFIGDSIAMEGGSKGGVEEGNDEGVVITGSNHAEIQAKKEPWWVRRLFKWK